MPLNIKCNFCSFAELRSFPFVFPYVLIAVYGDRPNLAEKNPANNISDRFPLYVMITFSVPG